MNQHKFINIYCKACGKQYSVMLRCGDIFCPECNRKRFYYLYYAYRELLKGKDNLRLVTLTVKNFDYSEVDVIRLKIKFYRMCLRKLLRKLRERIVGGIYCIQFTEKGRGWNFHIHLLCEGTYIDVYLLSKKWESITGDKVVDIRKVRNQFALKYVLGYLMKLEDIGRKDEYREIVKGIRMINKIGQYWGVKLLRRKLVCECGGVSFLTQFDPVWMFNFTFTLRRLYNDTS